MGTRSTVSDLSALLKAWGGGDLAARDELMPAVYEELRRRARAFFRREPVGHTLEPTALVHEAYLRLIKQDRIAWENRAQFYGVAAQMMRRILVDHARARNMPKRSGQWGRVPLVDFAAAHQTPEVDVLDLHAALDELASFGRPQEPDRGSTVLRRTLVGRDEPRSEHLGCHGRTGMAGGARVVVLTPERQPSR